MVPQVKVSYKADRFTPEKKQKCTMKVCRNIAESEGIKEMLNQAAVQVATAVMIAFRDVDGGP